MLQKEFHLYELIFDISRLIYDISRELIFSINVNSIIKELTLNCFADYCENEFHVCGQDHVLKNKITYHIVI